jgi:hypothetical protein
MDLHWTLAQCRMLAGESAESLTTLDRIRRGPHAKHRRARSGWYSLTVTEIKTAAFRGGGLSNPEIAARPLLNDCSRKVRAPYPRARRRLHDK